MATEKSGLSEALTTRVEGIRRGLEQSRFIGTVETASRWVTNAVRNSWLYNWLTAEPEPEVIVIDLRETWTVGPFIKILDWAIETTKPWYEQSVLKRGVNGVVALGEQAAETRPGQLLIALLEPPESPEERDETEDDQRNEK
ncbi:hypothetical protein SY89_00162 [Halolamina pelagica]|uniref:Uncharacterized protein n=1 Tax=Halolamina pelagica TaxID=699431 RepID=A0A0P7G867_9EURY|nr:hypothetical protein [Halolamina pelagica]KPN29449.1 hypothetical protein SY89_00162 [Halolamina pelagica]